MSTILVVSMFAEFAVCARAYLLLLERAQCDPAGFQPLDPAPADDDCKDGEEARNDEGGTTGRPLWACAAAAAAAVVAYIGDQ